MLRLSVEDGQRFETAWQLDMSCGRAEANMAMRLSQLGETVKYVTNLPANSLAKVIIQQLKAYDVDRAHIL